jgi:hypothetical protein
MCGWQSFCRKYDDSRKPFNDIRLGFHKIEMERRGTETAI